MASVQAALTPRLERTAGRMPGQSRSTPAQLTQRHVEVMRRAPPPRTPPSIPLPTARTSLPRSTPRRTGIASEFDHVNAAMARRKSYTRSLLRHFKDVRGSADSLRSISTAPSPATQALVGGTLQVCRLNVPLSRYDSLPSLFSEYSFSQENLPSILKQPTQLSIQADHTLTSIDETTDTPRLDRMVSFCQPAPVSQSTAPTKPMTDQACQTTPSTKPLTAPVPTQPQRSGSLRLSCQTTSLYSSRSGTALPGPRDGLLSSRMSARGGGVESLAASAKNLARIGRPIAQYTVIPDPGELSAAVLTQKEAAAAVDIQRIFRGYVARNAYKKLLKHERQKMEDRQRAAMEIQRAYRQHVGRKRTIENRPYNPSMLEWAHNYRINLCTRDQQRQVKVEQRAEQLSDNFVRAHSKLSVIGPHVNIYDIWHPKKTGPTKKELSMAATSIQRHVRGWLVRRRFDKLHRKAAWYGSTFPKMVKDYKTMLTKVQRQHGVEHPQTPFSTKDINDYIDTRRRYETVFEKKAFGGELEVGDIDSYFKECDLYPSQGEVDRAMKVIFNGETVSRQGRGLKRSEILEVVFYIYTPTATGLENTRHSTWLNPIIDGVEARRLLGSEYVEEAPLEVCAQLVISTIRERHEQERAAERARKQKEAAELRERLGLPQPKDDDEEDEREERRRRRRLKRVTLAEPAPSKDLPRKQSTGQAGVGGGDGGGGGGDGSWGGDGGERKEKVDTPGGSESSTKASGK